MEIERAENGYIVKQGMTVKRVFITLDDVMDYMLTYYEGRAAHWNAYGGYGAVRVYRDKEAEVAI